MQLFNSTTQYGLISKILHWSMAALIIVAIILIEIKDFYPKGSEPRELIKYWHIQFGLFVMFLVIARFTLKLKQNSLELIAQPFWQQSLVRGLHWLFYIMMFVLPFAGLLMSQAANKPAKLFGIPMPVFIEPNQETAHFLKEIHETLGNIMIYLIIFHIVAAFYHQWFKRDNILKRML
jgi:cytochrome b561